MKLPFRVFTLGVLSVFLFLMVRTWLDEVAWQFGSGTSYTDSLQFYTGASLLSRGESAHLYDLDAQASLQEKLLPTQYRPHDDWGLLPFLSPPFVAFALAPLASFSLPTFYAVTGAAQLILLAALAGALQHAAREWPDHWRLALLTLTLLWPPLSWSLLQGQVSILLATVLALSYLALVSRRDTLGGLALGMLWIKPQYAILVFIALLLWRRWRAAGAFAASTVLLLAVSWAAVGVEGLVAYVRLLVQIESAGAFYGMFPANYHTLSGLLLGIFRTSGWIWALVASLISILVLWQARHGFSPRSYALVILASVLVSPHTHSYDLAILLPTATLGWDALKQKESLATAWVFLWFVVEFGLYGLALNGSQFQLGPLITVPAMVFATCVLVFARFSQRPGLDLARA